MPARSMVACAALLGLSLLAPSPATADRMGYDFYAPADQTFWEAAIEPSGNEVGRLLRDATGLRQQADNLANADTDATGATRRQLYDEAIGALRAARRLAPKNEALLLQLGLALEGRGDGRAAIEALSQLPSIGDGNAEADLALGRVYLNAGDLTEALRFLRRAVSRPGGWSYDAQVVYASALAQAGRLSDAIEVVAPLAVRGGYAPILHIAVASLYDRDEQRGKAYDALARMNSQMGSGAASNAQAAVMGLKLPSPEKTYMLALAYESGTQWGEARTAWLNYVALGPRARYAGRAEAHVAAIDKLLAERKVVKPAPKPR